ncbi:MAG: DUF2853 family protein [Sulfurovaceae bacterium]|nr:DUF2853 family protein [Sulfurovaceae bacterium]
MGEKEENITLHIANTAEFGLSSIMYNIDNQTQICPKNILETNFLIKKYEVNISDCEMDAAFKAACRKIGRNNRNKYRAIFYEIITKQFQKKSMLG